MESQNNIETVLYKVFINRYQKSNKTWTKLDFTKLVASTGFKIQGKY